MSEFINIFEKILQYKNLIFSNRFIFLTVFIILTIITHYIEQYYLLFLFFCISLLLLFNSVFLYPWEKNYFKRVENSINNFNFNISKQLIENKTFLLSYPSKIKYEFLNIQYKFIFNVELESLFQNIELLQQKYLLEINGEKTKFILLTIKIYKIFENIKLLKETLKKVDESKVNNSQLLYYKSAQSFLCEYNGKIEQAKSILVSLQQFKDINKILLYNEIARLEESQSNYKQAIHYYEKSFDNLKINLQGKYFHIILHNLVIVNTRVNNISKSLEWLSLYESIVDKTNLSQYTAFLNTQILLARQISDKVLLLEAYSKISIFIEPKLNDEQWIINFSSKLRMSFNDNVNFDENIISAKNLFYKIKTLDFPKNYFISKEIFYILKTMDEQNQLGFMKNFYLELADYLYLFIETIRDYRKKLHDLAISEQFHWLLEENFLLKIQISRTLNRDDFQILFDDINQIKQYAKTYNSQYFLVKSTLMILDEFIAYSKIFNEQFSIDFKEKAIMALSEAEEIINLNTMNSRYFEFFILLSYYYLELLDNKEKANKYLTLFNKTKLDINQFAKWFRNYYDFIIKILK